MVATAALGSDTAELADSMLSWLCQAAAQHMAPDRTWHRQQTVSAVTAAASDSDDAAGVAHAELGSTRREAAAQHQAVSASGGDLGR